MHAQQPFSSFCIAWCNQGVSLAGKAKEAYEYGMAA